METNTYMTEGEFCERYLINPRTAQRWRRSGDGPRWCRFGPRRAAHREADCEAWAASRTLLHRAEELARELA